ncbi:50S ribosomal protein L15 [bacterium]|nr:50S ribosomal protein L15 [bacterium]
MNIGELNINQRKKNRKRIGRGTGSGSGTTAGRGMNGQRSRSGFKSRPWFEGGQMPLQRRVPKRGFHSRNKVYYQLVKLASLDRFEDGQAVDPALLVASGLIKSEKRPVKILGDGELNKKLVVTADKFSGSAKEKITQAGGEANIRSTDAQAEDAA